MQKYRQTKANDELFINYVVQTRSEISYGNAGVEEDNVVTRDVINTSLYLQMNFKYSEDKAAVDDKLAILHQYAEKNPTDYEINSTDDTTIVLESLSSDKFTSMVWYPHAHTAGSGPCTGHACAHTGLDSHTDTCLL